MDQTRTIVIVGGGFAGTTLCRGLDGELPPSVLAVLEADRNSGTYTPLRNATRGEWEVPVEMAVSGSRQLTLTLDQP